MDELVAFLRARLDEEEGVARAATPGPWEGVVDHHQRGEVNASVWADSINYYIAETITSGERHEADARHIGNHDPARTLADVESGRQAIAHYERVAAHRWKQLDYELAVGAVEVQLKIRALAYAGHQDYRQEWKP
jgi:hypothetical protein